MDEGFLDGLKAKLQEQMERARELCEPLNNEQLNWRPAPGKWSVAECIEHLTAGAEAYQPKLDAALEQNRNGDSSKRPKRSLFGNILLKVVDPENLKPMKAPKIFTPPSEVPGGALDRFTAAHDKLAATIDAANGHDLARSKVVSPISFLFRMNLADALEMLVLHVERHVNQAERVTQSDEFPG